MGRRTVASYDDVLLQKCSNVIQKTLDSLNRNGELEHVEALYSSNTLAALQENAADASNATQGPSSSSASSSAGPSANASTRPPYTFEHFAEHLDVEDPTFHNLIELLVTLTARKAIAKAAQAKEELHTSRLNGQQSLTLPTLASGQVNVDLGALRSDMQQSRLVTRASRDCQREMMRNRALQGEIRGITHRNRRSRRYEDGSDSSSSSNSDGMNVRSPPPTRTIFSSLTDPYVYPPLQRIAASAADMNQGDGAGSRADEASTTRITSVGLAGATSRWLQRDFASFRRRAQQQQSQGESVRPGSSMETAANTSNVRGSTNESGIRAALRASDRNRAIPPDDGFHVSMSRNAASTQPLLEGGDYVPNESSDDDVFVRSFLRQPFPSDSRRNVSTDTTQPGQDSRTSIGAHLQPSSGLLNDTGLHATLAPDLLTGSRSPDMFSHPAVALDPPAGVQMSSSSTDEAGSASVRGMEGRLSAVRAALNRLGASGSSASNPSSPPEPPLRAATGLNRTREFETFAMRRRQDRRPREQSGDSQHGLDDGVERLRTETLDAAWTLSRAQATMDEIMGNLNSTLGGRSGFDRSTSDVVDGARTTEPSVTGSPTAHSDNGDTNRAISSWHPTASTRALVRMPTRDQTRARTTSANEQG